MKFFANIIDKFRGGRPVDWDDLEEALLRADLGVPLTLRIIDALQAQGSKMTADNVLEVARAEIAAVLPHHSGEIFPTAPQPPTVILVVGVNGTGKTTSTAKLAALLQSQNRKVLLAAADTFRAAAIEQLQTWGSRLGVDVVSGSYGANPASLCFDAWSHAKRTNADFLLCDTAGRLHTKNNLMQELSKISRTLAKQDPTAPHEKWLVVDATTGGNAVIQAREFHKAIGLTGLIVTKLDGSGKGGVVAAIAAELNIPTRFVGTGERPEDFAPFDPQTFVAGMV